jgi:hypothetical protein
MRDSKWVVSPATRVSWRHGRIEIASLRTGAIFQSDDPGILQVIHIFASATPIADAVRALMDVPAEDVSRCVDALIDGGVLIEDSNRG